MNLRSRARYSPRYADVGYAFILFTPDDVGALAGELSMQRRARQNVILECGLFLGLLGRRRVSGIVEDAARGRRCQGTGAHKPTERRPIRRFTLPETLAKLRQTYRKLWRMAGGECHMMIGLCED